MKVLQLATAKREAPPWQVAHETLSRLARERAAADAEEGRWLLAAQRAAVHVHLGYGGFGRIRRTHVRIQATHDAGKAARGRGARELAPARARSFEWRAQLVRRARAHARGAARDRARMARIRARQDAPPTRAGAGGQTAGRRTRLSPRPFGAAPRAALRSGGGNVR